jgi:glycosyltransferase involved in cell wall biosynthesis
MDPQLQNKTEAKMNSQIRVTVIVCTHNPIKEQLLRTLDALSSQTLQLSEWELVLVDNNSDSPLAQEYSLEWHPNAQWAYERSQGKPKAIMRGIHLARADLIITVDDDNILASDYLATAIKIQAENPRVGAFGSGTTEISYQGSLPSWFSPEIAAYIALRRVNHPMVFETLDGGENSRPWGLGLCITRRVAMAWLESCTSTLSKYPYLNGRKGTVIDDDLFSLCAVNEGLSYGIFPELRLQHLIEPSRLTLSYLANLAYDHGYSHAHYAQLSGGMTLQPIRIGSFKAAIFLLLQGKLKPALYESRHLFHHLRQSRQLQALRLSKAKGWNHAINAIENNAIERDVNNFI